MRTIQVVFEGGVFRPTEPVDWPEHSPGLILIDENSPQGKAIPADSVWDVLGRSIETGDAALAERHDEILP